VYRDRRAFKLSRFLKRVNLGHLRPANFCALLKGLDGDSTVFFPEDHRSQSKTIDSSDLVAHPTRTALEMLVKAQGYKSAELDWHEDARDWSHLDDYRRRGRVSYICTRATLSSWTRKRRHDETYFTSANSGTLHKKCSILSRARVHAVDQTSDSSRRRRTRSSLWRCR